MAAGFVAVVALVLAVVRAMEVAMLDFAIIACADTPAAATPANPLMLMEFVLSSWLSSAPRWWVSAIVTIVTDCPS